ncbi:inositol monophosphatase [Gonapodya prolifera JEL478]|uniref:Inositol-1-monophosphatase n=1 Tax=Gonapodya prolifera (strain JEL478) TaxID=1344416 RepID=A0A139A173_GONPJ|nr:inositol monophosphatase [Gonapodya prolifera JEL478]|eukprot:KXS10103.1 inositol monophosphatase [Gonapodya prolifera JEL478]
MDLDLPALLASAIHASRLAARLLLAAFRTDRRALALETKSSPADLVTQTDKACQEAIFTYLRRIYPDHAFIGEEDDHSAGKSRFDQNRPTWVVDPIDGTTNFVVGYPQCCVSIGLAVNGSPVLGVVSNPDLDELYYAYNGGGAWLMKGNHVTTIELPDPPIAHRLPLISSAPLSHDLSNALVNTEYGSDRRPHMVQSKITTISSLLQIPVRGIRSVGSAALSLCSVARASSDVYYEEGIHSWDVCAGVVIVRESGGFVANYKDRASLSDVAASEPYDLRARTVIAVRKVTDKDPDSAEETAARMSVLETVRKHAVVGMVGLERD